jgi:hypothetical protein
MAAGGRTSSQEESMSLSHKAFFASVLLASAAFCGPAAAHSPGDPSAVGDLGRLSAKAGAVIQGTVTGVTYKTSANADGSPGVPYTFVTYSVAKVLQGSSAKSVTLRFPGGSDGAGGFVDVEGVPLFEVGDEDILFVNTAAGSSCPLVNCEFGRFRVLDGKVYEAHGAPVVEIKGGKLVARGSTAAAFTTFSYPAPTFEALMKNPHAVAGMKAAGLSVEQARARYASAPKTISINLVDSAGAATGRAAAGDAAVSVSAVLSSIETAVRANPAKAAAAIASADPRAPIVEGATVAATPPSN